MMKKQQVIVLARATPSAKQLVEAVAVFEEFKTLVAARYPVVTIDLICAIEGQLSWLEYWPDKESLHKFYGEYIGFSDLPLRLVNASRHAPDRQHFQPLVVHN